MISAGTGLLGWVTTVVTGEAINPGGVGVVITTGGVVINGCPADPTGGRTTIVPGGGVVVNLGDVDTRMG